MGKINRFRAVFILQVLQLPDPWPEDQPQYYFRSGTVTWPPPKIFLLTIPLLFAVYSFLFPYLLLSCSYRSIFVIIHLIFTLLDHENIVPLISLPLFLSCISFCSLISFYIYLIMGLLHDSLLCTYINPPVRTHSVVRTLFSIATQYTSYSILKTLVFAEHY